MVVEAAVRSVRRRLVSAGCAAAAEGRRRASQEGSCLSVSARRRGAAGAPTCPGPLWAGRRGLLLRRLVSGVLAPGCCVTAPARLRRARAGILRGWWSHLESGLYVAGWCRRAAQQRRRADDGLRRRVRVSPCRPVVGGGGSADVSWAVVGRLVWLVAAPARLRRARISGPWGGLQSDGSRKGRRSVRRPATLGGP